jgi:hypothetical protein
MEINGRDNLLKLKFDILSTLEKLTLDADDREAIDRLSMQLSCMIEDGKRINREHQILQSLQFKSMTVRHSKIAAAHRKTFDWIFRNYASKDSCSIKFADWLRSGDGIYWIAGKAGSGKSTLMKYLYDDPRTAAELHKWSGRKKLVTASYYFWNAGTDMQKSQEGLLQSLLYEVLRRFPALIPTILPSHWESQALGNTHSWILSELSEAFKLLKAQDKIPVAFCFFVDGLDEYEGDHNEIIVIFKDFISSSNIKVCVSSRPWNVFEDAFGGVRQQRLLLQELTYDDIKLYVKNKLEEDGRFAQLQSEDDRYQELILDIVNKADGVFLWVFLVVRSLLHGLTNADRIRDLQRRLEELPSDLEKYFQYMLDSVDKVYWEEAAQLFQVAVEARQPLTLLTYSFLDEEDPNFALDVKIRELQKHEAMERYDNMRKRLNARCQDLLEINSDPLDNFFNRYKVDFLHRTVRDFLKTRDMQQVLAGRINSDFYASVSLCKSFLAQVKCAMSRESNFLYERGPLWVLVVELLYYARQAEENTGKAQTRILDELDRVIGVHSGTGATVNVRVPQWQYSFMALTVRADLRLYVKEKSNKPLYLAHQNGVRPLLDHALDVLYLPSETAYRVNSPLDTEMVRILLEHGANPNQEVEGVLVCKKFNDNVNRKWTTLSPDLQMLCSQAIDLLLQYGSKIEVINRERRYRENPKQNKRFHIMNWRGWLW